MEGGRTRTPRSNSQVQSGLSECFGERDVAHTTCEIVGVRCTDMQEPAFSCGYKTDTEFDVLLGHNISPLTMIVVRVPFVFVVFCIAW
jgi:hypothetical protein